MTKIRKNNVSKSENSNLISSISSNLRQNILSQLLESPQTLTEISRNNDISATEGYRNIKKLEESKLVEKNHDGFFEITTSGKCVMKILPSFYSISTHNIYLNKHKLEFLPSFAIQQLGSLANGIIINDAINVIEKLREIISNSSTFHLVVAPQMSPELVEYHLKNKSNLNTKVIFGNNSVIPPRVKTILEDYFKDPSNLEGYSFKKVERLNFFLCLSDSEGGITFFDSDNHMDLNSLIYGNDHEFLQWCKELFEFEWSKGTELSIDELF